VAEPRRISDEVRTAVAADLRQNAGTPEGSLAKIAGRHGVSVSTVKRIGAAHGIDPALARVRAEKAVQISRLSNAQRREALSVQLLDKVQGILDSLGDEVYVYSFGGQYNQFSDAKAKRPSPADLKNLATAAGILLDKHKVLEQFDSAAAGAQQAEVLLRLITGDGQR
jgi:transposase-like protein